MRRRLLSPRCALEALEPLVLVSGALAGPRARTVLDGLFAPLAAAAVARLAELDRRDTSEKHARWMQVFGPVRGRGRTADDIPGSVGRLTRARLAGHAPQLEELAQPPPCWVRWSSRLAMERRGSDAPLGPPARRRVSSTGRERGRAGGRMLARASQEEPRACSPSLVRPVRSTSIGG